MPLGKPGLSPAWGFGDSVEHTSVTSPWEEGSEEAGILIHQLAIFHWLRAASWCTGACSKEKEVLRQRVAGTGSQAALACRGGAGGCGQTVCLHLGPPDEREPGPCMERKDPVFVFQAAVTKVP